MNCYNHPNDPAIGFCKSCCKGLCMECAATLPNGLACRNQCEERVSLINQIIDNNQKVVSAANMQVRSSGIFILLLGIIFCSVGFLPLMISGSTVTLFIMGLPGLLFTVFGAMRLLKKSQQFPSAK
jgi:Flp pilus assembly protein TadB